jgi:precorrin-2 methylase
MRPASDVAGNASRIDLHLIGCGLRSLDHLTREADGILRRARVIFHSIYNRDLLADLQRMNPDARLLCQEDGEYIVGQYRPDIYRRIADRVFEEALRGPGVAVLHPGSAVLVDAIGRHLVSRGVDAGIGVRIVPGISSVEFVLCEMAWDPADGLQVILAQNLVLGARRLDPTQAAIVIQPGYYDTRWFVGAPFSAPGRFDALARALGASHAPEAPMALVLAPVAASETAQVLWFRLGQLEQVSPVISPFHTLFIPPAQSPRTDAEFARRIDSWPDALQHLAPGTYGSPRQVDPRVWFEHGANLLAPELIADSHALANAWRQRCRTLAEREPRQ